MTAKNGEKRTTGDRGRTRAHLSARQVLGDGFGWQVGLEERDDQEQVRVVGQGCDRALGEARARGEGGCRR